MQSDKNTLVVRLTETRSSGKVTRTANYGEGEVWWELAGTDASLPGPLLSHDLAASALVFYAMHHGRNLYIDGPVTFSMLKNLEDLIVSWVVWRPDLYRIITVDAATELPDSAIPTFDPPRAIAAFSGGLDASYTAWRHAKKRVGRRSLPLSAGVLFQGFDIGLDKDKAFAISAATVTDSLNSINVPMVSLRTNWRDQVGVDWLMEYGTAVATGLRNWQGYASVALIGSDADYTRIELPLGGNPITYSMLSSRDFQIVSDGGEFARTEKAEGISDWEAGMKNLRVCWQGPVTGRNCGECEKCVRTKLNFMAVGSPLPESLPGQPTEAQIRKMRTRTHVAFLLLQEVLQIAEKRGVTLPWVEALRYAIRKNKALMVLRPDLWKGRVKKVLVASGVFPRKSPIKTDARFE